MTEDQLHMSVIEWLNLSLPQGAVYHHSPQENKAHVAHRMKLKRRGTQTGWPDIEIFYRGRAIFIELKVGYKKPTDAQERCHEALTLAGAVVKVCKSLPEVEGFLNAFIPEMRGSVTA